MTLAARKTLRIFTHIAVLAGLYLVFSFALFLGLSVDPSYGNIGIAVTLVLVALYVYIGFVRK